jgi:two-component system, OmpR family, sensor histidine kinase BaeS
MTTRSPTDPTLPELLTLSAHEFRNTLAVATGYIRFLFDARGGPLTEPQRLLLKEVEKSCARVAALVKEMSYLSDLEAGTVPFNRSRTDLRTLLAEAIAALTPMPDRQMDVELTTGDGTAFVVADAVRLTEALTAVFHAIRREVVAGTTLLVRERIKDYGGRRASWLAIAEPDRIDSLEAATTDALTTFDESRGGCGLSLPIARRIFVVHGGAVWSPAQNNKSAAVVVLPHA